MKSVSNKDRIEKIMRLDGLEIRTDAPLKECTTIGIGGACSALVRVRDEASLVACLGVLKDTSMAPSDIFVLGGGSNLLVSDLGFGGIVLRLGEGFKDLIDHGGRISVGAALPVKDLALMGVREGWGGLEHFVGLPGTIGGAVRMNAGAWGKEIWDYVARVCGVDIEGHPVDLPRADAAPAYRDGGLGSDLIVTRVELIYEGERKSVLMRRSKQFMVRRKEHQAVRSPSFGSVFRNPAGFHAGQLIDSLGLKGMREGDAMISAEHANFIVNLGDARAVEVLSLMRMVRRKVREAYGIDLEPEVVFLGMTDDDLEGIR